MSNSLVGMEKSVVILICNEVVFWWQAWAVALPLFEESQRYGIQVLNRLDGLLTLFFEKLVFC